MNEFRDFLVFFFIIFVAIIVMQNDMAHANDYDHKITKHIDFTKKVKSISYKVRGKKYTTLNYSDLGVYEEIGDASWYGPGFHGRKTASGEIYDMNDMTAAHKELPLGTKVKVTNLHNGKSVVVRINDRGPFHGNRIIDLSKAAARKIGSLDKGVVKVIIVLY